MQITTGLAKEKIRQFKEQQCDATRMNSLISKYYSDRIGLLVLKWEKVLDVTKANGSIKSGTLVSSNADGKFDGNVVAVDFKTDQPIRVKWFDEKKAMSYSIEYFTETFSHLNTEQPAT